MIELNQVSYQYDDMTFNFDFRVAAKQKTVIVGPSGAGKSTLLSLIAGFILPESGTIFLNQQAMTLVPPSKRPVSMLFQQNNVFEHLTVFQNVALGIKPSLKLNESERFQVNQTLAKVGLSQWIESYPDKLSGGQRQRVALARCLIQRRPILLLDEPFSALDQALRYDMLQQIDAIAQEFGLTVVMVSHFLDKTLDYFDQCLVVDKGQIIFDDLPTKLTKSESGKLATLLGLNHPYL